MITRTVRSRYVFAGERLDVKYYTSVGVESYDRIAFLSTAGIPMVQVRDVADVTDAPRFKRVYATPDEPSLPYLRPYDIFDYLPAASDHLSLDRNPGIDGLRVEQ